MTFDRSRVPGFEDVVEAYGEPLWRLTAGYARTQADREDLYQEILVGVWRSLPRFRGDSSLRTFLYRIAHNRGLTFRAREARRATRERDVSEALPDPSPRPDEVLRAGDEAARLTAAIGGLLPSLAQVVMLHLEGLSHADIAQILGITENNVGVRLSRAKSELARSLTSGMEAGR